MNTVSGGCHCGNILLDLKFSRAFDTYQPRVCDCDFCIKHGATYVSDPQGSLTVHIKDERQTNRYRQGAGIAECLLCTSCGVYVGALYHEEGRLYATVNTKVLDPRLPFGAEVPVSPKTLAPDAKKSRWLGIWFSDVTVTSVPAAGQQDL